MFDRNMDCQNLNRFEKSLPSFLSSSSSNHRFEIGNCFKMLEVKSSHDCSSDMNYKSHKQVFFEYNTAACK